jgi:tripeptidyl-peptidase-1
MDEVTAVLAVPEERAAAVAEHFKSAGAKEIMPAPNRDMLTVTLSVAAAESALSTTIHTFSHKDRPDLQILRASGSYSLPEALAKDVDMVGDLLHFPRLPVPLQSNLMGSGTWPNACSASGCKGLVTPAVLTQRYKLPSKEPAVAGSTNSMAVSEFQGQYFQDSDLDMFGKACHVDAEVDRVVGGNKPSAGVEAELDIEYIKAVAESVPLTVVYNGDYSLLRWVNQISSMSNPPYINSVSYGNDEAQQSGAEYMYTCNTAFMKAGVRGVSILFASGDQGVCGREGCGFMKIRFKPDFPAASPYITAVGGTNFLGSSIGEETTWSGSGGGFSDTFEIPSYQQHAVAAYKASPDAKLPPQAWWNNTGRGYPDISALGGTKTPYCVVSSGSFGGVAGTSASSPVVAGIFARLNGLRLAAGKPPMGFLNPFIYANPSAFQDVTTGKNGGSSFRPKLGFNAVKGWDPATGWGTPNYEALAKVVMEAVGSAKVKDDVSIVV